MTRRLPSLLLVLTVCLGGCVRALPLSAFERLPAMRPETFFAGRTSSWGVLENRAGAPTRWFTVHGQGATQPDGGFRLDQTIGWNDGAVDKRSWVMRRTSADGYEATLTDASGPVRAEVRGNVFHLTYPLKVAAGTMEQWLYLQGDGRTVLNEGTVRILGVTVLRLSERISHDDAAPSAPPR